MKLIMGLGNPGRDYARNRHNVGFMCLNHFARQHGIRFDKKQGKARIGSGEVADSQVVLAKPQTYMNRSGQSVSLLVRKFDVSPDDLLVIHDDLDIPLGKIRIRTDGSSGGHKGIGSIITELGTQNFTRIRVGIGRSVTIEGTAEINEADTKTYVLSDFTPDEKQVITRVIPVVSEAILCLLTESLVVAMNRYN
ncbi:aminoacyl-tRNA hydrolase [Chloroflexota bacterium]